MNRLMSAVSLALVITITVIAFAGAAAHATSAPAWRCRYETIHKPGGVTDRRTQCERKFASGTVQYRLTDLITIPPSH